MKFGGKRIPRIPTLWTAVGDNVARLSHFECRACGRMHPIELAAMVAGQRSYPRCCDETMHLVTERAPQEGRIRRRMGSGNGLTISR